MALLIGVTAACAAAVGAILLAAERGNLRLAPGVAGLLWGAMTILGAGAVTFVATVHDDRSAALGVAVLAAALLAVPAGLWAAATAAVASIRRAREHAAARLRSHVSAEVIHTRLENTLERDMEAAGVEDDPDLGTVAAAARAAEVAIRPPRRVSGPFVRREWDSRADPPERYYNPLDVPRSWHDSTIERLTLQLTFQLRLLLVALVVLAPGASAGPAPDPGEPSARTVVWLLYLGLALTTAVVAPRLVRVMMDKQASGARGLIGSVELALGLAACLAFPGWPVAAAVLSSVLNVWNREGTFSWSRKVPAASVAIAITLEAGLLLEGVGGWVLLTEPALAGAALALMSSSYGVWFPFSGAVLTLRPLAERSGRRVAERAMAAPRAELERVMHAAEGRLAGRARAGDGAAHERLCILRRARRAYGSTTDLPERMGEIARLLLPPSRGIARLEAVVVECDPELEPLRFRDDDTRVCFAGAVELLGQEAARHGAGTLRVHIVRREGAVAVAATNELLRPVAAPGTGGERLAELAAGLGGAAAGARAHGGLFSAGFEFPREVLR